MSKLEKIKKQINELEKQARQEEERLIIKQSRNNLRKLWLKQMLDGNFKEATLTARKLDVNNYWNNKKWMQTKKQLAKEGYTEEQQRIIMEEYSINLLRKKGLLN